ncbi:putative lunapark domain-containing protein, partial [Tanacetum coccineum]
MVPQALCRLHHQLQLLIQSSSRVGCCKKDVKEVVEEKNDHSPMGKEKKEKIYQMAETTRNIIVSSLFLEVLAIGYAVMTTRSGKLDTKMMALRVLPIFVLPVISWALYSRLKSLTGMCERKDQRTLASLRAKRQEKIDELKERTNYYNTQQLIQ